MHLLPCPTCGSSIPVSPAQAGDRTTCPGCNDSVVIPKLGELRLLPRVNQSSTDQRDLASAETSAARSFGFGLFACLAAGSLMVGGFCGIRWFLTDVPLTTDQHTQELRTALKTVDPASLIREYEDMEKYGLDLPEPYKYKVAENTKRAWGRNALLAGSIGLGAFLIASILAMAGRTGGQPSKSRSI